MIRIALVEDEAEVRAQLQGYVQRHTRQYGTEFAVTEFADGMELLDDYRPVYDILFLDVEMKHLDGMETARRVRELDKDVIIVFITNMAQYAIGGYAVGALDYVLKPVPYFAFSQQLRKAEEQLRRHEEYFADFAWRDKSEQYKRMLREYPQLLQRIALKDLAAYLFVTPQSLSRIRAEIK